jgi:hypothetical protein
MPAIVPEDDLKLVLGKLGTKEHASPHPPADLLCSGGWAEPFGMALGAGILERVTRQTSSHIQHGWSGVGACLENRQWHVAAGQLIMTAAAIIRGVAGRAVGAIERGILAVNVVLPPRGVRRGLHH